MAAQRSRAPASPRPPREALGGQRQPSYAGWVDAGLNTALALRPVYTQENTKTLPPAKTQEFGLGRRIRVVSTGAQGSATRNAPHKPRPHKPEPLGGHPGGSRPTVGKGSPSLGKSGASGSRELALRSWCPAGHPRKRGGAGGAGSHQADPLGYFIAIRVI